jgi:TRAP-type C4-dicarboxylate transport system permease large subunit
LIPGALTGAGAATVLTVGSLVGTVLICMGVSKTRTVAIVFLCAAMSAGAPPVNLWAMMAAAGANMPYVGFMLPLLILTVVGALLSMFILAGKGAPIELEKVLAELPKPPEEMNWLRVAIPFVVFFGLVISGRIWPFHVPILGLPLMFLIAAIAVLLLSPKKIPILEIAGDTIHSLIPLVGIMVVVGILIQIMALSGARGLISLAIVILPLGLLYATLFLILPISEGLLQYAVAPLLGVPLIFLFNMKGLDPIIALSAMAVMWPLGDCLPPTAVVGRAAVIELKYTGGYYKEFVKTCLIPMICILLICTLFLIFSTQLRFLVGG